MPRKFLVELDCLPRGCSLEAWAVDSLSVAYKVGRTFVGARWARIRCDSSDAVELFALGEKGPVRLEGDRRKATQITA